MRFRGVTQASWKQRENFTAYLMTLPAVTLFVLFTLIPIGYVLLLSFASVDTFVSFRFVGLRNYANLLTDAAWWNAVRNTFVFALGKLAIEIPLGLTLAIILNQELRGFAIFRTVFFLPYVTSIAVMGIVFFFLLTPNRGVLNELLQMIGLIQRPIDFLGQPTSAMLSVIGVSVWGGFGINTVLFLAGLQTVPKDVLESAEIDGANPFQKTLLVTIPLLGPTFKLVTLLALVFTMRTFDLVWVMTRGGPWNSTDIMFTYIFTYFFGTDRAAQYGYGAALGVAAALIITLVSLLHSLLTRRLDR
jgi:raffinose/stachyose/melibiose transport system permease protein